MKQNTLFAQILSTVTRYLKILVVIVVAGICLSGIRVVESGNVALILRFGQLVGNTPQEQIHESGLLLAFPYIIDEVIVVPTSSIMEQSITTYYTPETGSTWDGTYVLTGDENIATLSASVKYIVDDPVAYALNVSDIPAVINACVSNAMLSEAAGSDVDDLLTSGKDLYARRVLNRAAEKLALSQVGVELTTVELTQVSMPQQVRAVYDDVNAATVNAATILEHARNSYNTTVLAAEGEATALLSAANSEKAAAISAATADMAEFWGLMEEYGRDPQVVRTRLYSQKVSGILDTIGSIRVVEDGQSKLFLNP